MQNDFPVFLAGPILRRTTANEICLWAITSRPIHATFQLYMPSESAPLYASAFEEQPRIELGDRCHVVMAAFTDTQAFPTNTPLEYDIIENSVSLLGDIEGLRYDSEARPTFVISTHADYIAHGSCRHPHHPCEDALVALDHKNNGLDASARADLLIMSGDQIYADDVCGPLMFAIRQTITLLGMRDQTFEHAPISACSGLTDTSLLYKRDALLPRSSINHGLFKRLFKAEPEPVFSSRTTENHLISFNEFIAMYMLVWSPSLWAFITLPENDEFPSLTTNERKRWDDEKAELKIFCEGLPQVRRLMAHIPTYMIFDDHDITDDFNLTVGWERAIYESPFAHAIINNGMLGYFFCQGWGNNPTAFSSSFWQTITRFTATPNTAHLNEIITLFQHFEQWHYTIPTSPKVVVIDTRTRRWRSESSSNKPSGLMDWESLMDFQQDVFNNDAVVVVSSAPMFGVKFIETMQRIATLCGQPLATDSENWMAHPGSANALLNIFKHPKTPKNFVILSGDVHYSFAYDIRLRFRKGSPRIWQITCSGLRNQFPEPYLSFFEWFDRKLFWPESPLNVFTRRKRMRIERRCPDNGSNQYLLNRSAIGEVHLHADGSPSRIGLLTSLGEDIAFSPKEDEQDTFHEEADRQHP